METFLGDESELHLRDIPVNELSIYPLKEDHLSTTFLVEITRQSVILQSDVPFALERRGTRLVINAPIAFEVRLTPEYAACWVKESQNSRDETSMKTVYYDRSSKEGVLRCAPWYNFYGLTNQASLEKYERFLTNSYQTRLRNEFIGLSGLEDPETTKHEKNREEVKEFYERLELYERENQDEIRREIEAELHSFQEWLDSEFLTTSKEIDSTIKEIQRIHEAKQSKYIRWHVQGEALNLEFFNVHGVSFAIDLYNHSLEKRRIVLGKKAGDFHLAAYEHLHLAKTPRNENFKVTRSMHYLSLETIGSLKTKHREEEEEENEKKKRKLT